jgi:hypothetical protein
MWMARGRGRRARSLYRRPRPVAGHRDTAGEGPTPRPRRRVVSCTSMAGGAVGARGPTWQRAKTGRLGRCLVVNQSPVVEADGLNFELRCPFPYQRQSPRTIKGVKNCGNELACSRNGAHLPEPAVSMPCLYTAAGCATSSDLARAPHTGQWSTQ